MSKPPHTDIIEVAQALHSGSTEVGHLRSAEAIIRQGAGPDFFSCLIDLERAAQADSKEAIAESMRKFERVMPVNPAVGAYLMGRLYAFSWRTSDHSVYNAIELWMDNTASSAAADALQLLSTEPIRPALKKRCASWAKMMRDKLHI